MPADLVTITSYLTAHEAYIAKACLEEEGIYVFLQDIETVGLQLELSSAIGGVKLQVPAADADHAREMLNKMSPPPQGIPNPYAPDESDTGVCLRCGHNMPDEVDQCSRCGWTFHYSDE